MHSGHGGIGVKASAPKKHELYEKGNSSPGTTAISLALLLIRL